MAVRTESEREREEERKGERWWKEEGDELGQIKLVSKEHCERAWVSVCACLTRPANIMTTGTRQQQETTNRHETRHEARENCEQRTENCGTMRGGCKANAEIVCKLCLTLFQHTFWRASQDKSWHLAQGEIQAVDRVDSREGDAPLFPLSLSLSVSTFISYCVCVCACVCSRLKLCDIFWRAQRKRAKLANL